MILFILALVGLVITIIVAYGFFDDMEPGKGILTIIIGLIITAICIVGGIVYLRSASFQREIKDLKSDYCGGISRTIIITAEDGREIYNYTGTVDLEIDADTRKIKFEDENNKRQIIIYGVQDTVTIIEN